MKALLISLLVIPAAIVAGCWLFIAWLDRKGGLAV